MNADFTTLIAGWRDRADELRPYAPAASEAFRVAAGELESALRDSAAEPLTLDEAAQVSGYSKSRLRHLVAEGHLPNAGRKGAPRILRHDLPSRQKTRTAFDAGATARRVLGKG